MPDVEIDRAVTLRSRFIVLALALVVPTVTLCLYPDLDLAIAALFYDASRGGFYLAAQPVLVALHIIATKGAWLLGFLLLILTVTAWLRRQPVCGHPVKSWAFLLIALIVGPALIANLGFKDHWGRARPREIVAFGGLAHFSPALSPQPVLHKNGSFVNGDAAFGFFLPNFACLFRRPEDRKKSRRVFWGGLLAGGIFGVTRIAMGAHFPSDTFGAALIVLAVSALIHTVLYGYKETRRMWQFWVQ